MFEIVQIFHKLMRTAVFKKSSDGQRDARDSVRTPRKTTLFANQMYSAPRRNQTGSHQCVKPERRNPKTGQQWVPRVSVRDCV